ncbi:MAG: hypothetical protein C4309_06830 [Chloroflexota bacterium]
MPKVKRVQPHAPIKYRDEGHNDYRYTQSTAWRLGPLVLGLSALALIIGVLWLAASQKLAVGSPTVPPDTVDRPAAVRLGAPAPDFSVPTLDGQTFSLSAQRGKPTVILIMAYWCSSCVPEARAMTRLYQEYGDRAAFVALDVDPSSTPEDLRAFKALAGDGNYVWALDTGQKVASTYRVRALDTTFIVDRDGTLVYQDTYPTPYETLKAELEKLLP